MSDETPKLRTGWTTGTCAAAAAGAAAEGLWTGAIPAEVTVKLPKGQTPSFAIERSTIGPDWADAWIRKDAGDDPDVTHQALIGVRVCPGPSGSGLTYRAGDGVGTVTKPGLPLAVGEPAINPVPRKMIDEAVSAVAARTGDTPDLTVTVSVEGGAALADKTWNPRLGIVGGISILGTTGIVRPFSCAAWIASIHRGIDVARAEGLTHVLGATGATSEATAQAHYGLSVGACLDMGDFAGGLMKYLRRNPVPRLTLAGGIGKLTKLGQGALDLHSGRSQVDFARLAETAAAAGLDPGPVAAANTALAALTASGPRLAEAVALQAHRTAYDVVGDDIALDVMVVDRSGQIIAHHAP
ncbi:MAG: cobalt-precorrin-5B (C(1))-methyltransferase [Pseudomonadota bacterium]